MNKHALWMLRVVFTLLAATTACAMGVREDEMAAFMMSEKEETSIQVAAGETFAIRFQTSTGTGYSWDFAVELDGKLLEFLAERTEEPGSMRLGGKVFVIWTFRALAAGETAIAMKYARPWETEAAPARTHVFKVKIQ